MDLPLPEVLYAPLLRLRRPEAADAQAIFAAYTQDPQVARYMLWTPHANLGVTEAFIAACQLAWDAGTRMPYVITEHADGNVVGMLEARPQATTVDIGYVLARSAWGRGYMPCAIRALAAVALARPRFFRVQATCDVENFASQRALEKAGFRKEGRLERFTVHPNVSSEPRASFMYAIWR